VARLCRKTRSPSGLRNRGPLTEDHAGSSQAYNTSRAFTAALDREGFSFHQAVLRHCLALTGKLPHALTVEVSEFPFQSAGKDGRIDFILRIRSPYSDPTVFLICECKRSNPTLNKWCFARSPFIRRPADRPQHVVADSVIFDPHRVNGVAVAMVSYEPQQQPYHLGLPVRASSSEQEKESGGNARKRLRSLRGKRFAQRTVSSISWEPTTRWLRTHGQLWCLSSSQRLGSTRAMSMLERQILKMASCNGTRRQRCSRGFGINTTYLRVCAMNWDAITTTSE
jgi:hypothetical protein